MLQLVKNQSGVYEYKEVGATPSSSLRSTDFEAYEGTQKTTLAESTDLGSQTKSLMREAPGQMEVVTDAQTGETKTVNKGSSQVAVQQREFKNITPTSNENALDKIARITSANPQGTDSSQDLNRVYNLIERQQKLKEQAQQFNQLYKGADLAFRAYDTFTNIKDAGRLNIVPMKGGSTLNPISGFMNTSVGKSTVGGVGTAGMAGYGISKMLGGSKKQNTGAGIGSAIGMGVGGPIGGVVGGVIGAVVGCFLPNTKVTMLDGTTKNIIDINLNDNISIGGRVFAHAKFLITDLYDYKGVKVSGSHMVNEDNKWLRVEESKLAKSLGNKEHTVYTLGTDNRRILINNILFTDYFEVDEKEELQTQGDEYFNNWKNHSIELQEQNKNILNAI